jgi:hypothetical protein
VGQIHQCRFVGSEQAQNRTRKSRIMKRQLKSFRRRWFLPLGVLILATGGGLCWALSQPPAQPQPAPAGQARLEYNRDIRPILAENCFACHGPDSAARKAKLRLDVRDEAVKRTAIVPGQPNKSLLVERIFAQDTKHQMPPAKTHKKLTATQKETLKRWITEGAEYQPHWAFIDPKRPPVPAVQNKAWVRNTIDSFILATLEAKGLTPVSEADRWTLGRRASLDLTGLPPSPQDLEAFVNDPRPDAYEHYIDNLLKSPHWGEHRAHYWLDVARYADSHGIHFDNFREIWAYRDWVIDAFNRNMPFDQFTIEQLAGDLLPNPTLDQLVATGFNRCNITTNEGGVIPEEYLVLYTRDRTETIGQTWLGMTAGCAVCHDHKYDPLSQREFYEMAAFFNNTTQGAMDGNIKDTPPIIFVPSKDDRPKWNGLSKELAAIKQKLEARKQSAQGDFEKWLATTKTEAYPAMIPTKGLHFHAALNEGMGQEFKFTLNGKPQSAQAKGIAWDKGHVATKAFKSVPGAPATVPDAGDFDKHQGFTFAAWVQLPKGQPVTGAIAARMDDKSNFRGWDLWVEGNKVGTHIIHKWPDDALKVTTQKALKPGEWHHVLVSYNGSGKAAGVHIYIDGVAEKAKNVVTDKLQNTIRTNVPLTVAQRHTTSPIPGVLLQDLRIYQQALSGLEAAQLVKGTRAAWLLSKPFAQQSAEEKKELLDWWLVSVDPAYQGHMKELSALQQEETAIKSRGTNTHITVEKKEQPHAYILFRGEYDKRKDKVLAETPKFLPPLAKDLPKNRLGFAKWLLAPENPLTTRVTVNRFWQEVFGRGLVRTAGDLGGAGELPTHPELLDWLAVEFRESGWDIKKFFKMIVTSATYRQAVVFTKDKLEKDPDNRFLSRGPHYRLDAEMLRDYALAASGLLVRKLGGPSVKPYQPPGVWEAVGMIGSNTRDYVQDKGEKLYRRSLYTFWKRAAPPASLDILNAPNREFCTVARERTNTPLQALVTLNDPQFVEAARHLAQVTLQQGGNTTEARIEFMAKKVLCRPLKAKEVQIIQKTYNGLYAYYQKNVDNARKLIAVGESKADPALEPARLAAWTMVANQMFNLDEVLNK